MLLNDDFYTYQNSLTKHCIIYSRRYFQIIQFFLEFGTFSNFSTKQTKPAQTNVILQPAPREGGGGELPRGGTWKLCPPPPILLSLSSPHYRISNGAPPPSPSLVKVAPCMVLVLTTSVHVQHLRNTSIDHCD